jgi:hypothetical protein
LNQQDKGRDSSAKSNATNLIHLVQVCDAGADPAEDFRACDTAAELGPQGIPIDPRAPTATTSDCPNTNPGAIQQEKARVAVAGKDCFVVVAASRSGNKFWYVKHNDGSVFRNCTTRGVNGCPTNGEWAG